MFRFAAPNVAPVTTQRLFVGLCAALPALGSVNPSANVNSIGVCLDLTDTTLSIYTNGGASTKTSLGVSFANSGVYELFLYCAPNSTTIDYSFRDVSTATTVRVDGTFSTNLPSNGTGINGLQAYAGIGTSVAAAVNFYLHQIYIESNY